MGKQKRWVLTDTANGTWVEELELDARDLGLPAKSGAYVRKQQLRGGLSEGVDLIEVSNGIMTVVILPTRGMGIWKAECRGDRLGWTSPVKGPVNPAYVHQNERGGLGWLQGFDELIVRCGLESNGAPGKDVIPNNMGDPTEMDLTLHGRIANIPAHYVDVDVVPGKVPEIRISGVVDEAMLFCPQLRLSTTISIKMGEESFTVVDEVTNLKSVPSEMELLYHVNFGPPYLGKGARLVLPVAETYPRSVYSAKDIDAWDRYAPPTPGIVEQCFWHVPLADARGNSVALLHDAAGRRGAAVRFNVKELPCFTQWKNCGDEKDGYVTGLEPATNYPNNRVFERKQGRVMTLKPGQTHRAALVVEACCTAASVSRVQAEIKLLQGRRPHKLGRKPVPKYSAC